MPHSCSKILYKLGFYLTSPGRLVGLVVQSYEELVMSRSKRDLGSTSGRSRVRAASEKCLTNVILYPLLGPSIDLQCQWRARSLSYPEKCATNLARLVQATPESRTPILSARGLKLALLQLRYQVRAMDNQCIQRTTTTCRSESRDASHNRDCQRRSLSLLIC